MKTNDDICQACRAGDCMDCQSTPKDFFPCKCECVQERGEKISSLSKECPGTTQPGHSHFTYQVYFRGMPLMELRPEAVGRFALEFKTFVDHESKTVVLF